MKATGNGKPEQCVANLLRLTRGEVPYARIKGLARGLLEQPAPQVWPLLLADAEMIIEAYEPRVSLDTLDLAGELAKAGHFDLQADILVEEG